MPYHSYIFLDTTPSLKDSKEPEIAQAKKECQVFLEGQKGVRVEAYAMLGFKPHTRFALHLNAGSPEEIQNLLRDLLHTSLGKHLEITYSLFGMTRSSQYNPHHAPKESSPDVPHKYLVVYPFTKTVAWHLLPYEERRNVMKAHVEVGRKYSDRISQLLLYAFGIDDHEFIVSYQMDSLEEFQSLVMDMRGTESRRHTENDLPIFMCIHKTLPDALSMV
jgi:chlorite dismutase